MAIEKRNPELLIDSPGGDFVSATTSGGTAAAAAESSSRAGSVVFFTLCAALVFAPVAFGAVDFWALGILALAVLIIAFAWLFETWKTGQFRFSANRLQLPLIGLILIGLIQLLPFGSADVADGMLSVPAVSSLSLDPYATRLAVVQLSVYLVFFAAALTFVNSQRRLQKIVLLVIVVAALLAFTGILLRLANPTEVLGVRASPHAIPFGPFINQHHFAAFMELAIGLTLGLLYNQSTRGDKRYLMIIAVVIMGTALIFTSSRGGMLSLLGVIAFVTLFYFFGANSEARAAGTTEQKSFFQGKFAVIGGGLALVLVLFGSILLLGGEQSLTRGIGLQATDDVSSGRTHFWSVALQIIRDYPILGAGLDAFGVAFTRYDTWNGTFRVEQAHNDYLQIFADAGIAGFVCAVAFIYFLFQKGFRAIGQTTDRYRRGVAVGALAGCFGILLHSFFDFPLRTPSNAFYFLTLAMLATISAHIPKPQKNE
jgi:O-antigen ligase